MERAFVEVGNRVDCNLFHSTSQTGCGRALHYQYGQYLHGMQETRAAPTIRAHFDSGFSAGRTRLFDMHYDAHQPVIDDLEARILTIRDSL